MTKIRLVHRDSLSCEAIVREMPNGELLMVSQCGGTSEPSPQNRVYFWHSPDNGETWKPGGLLWPEDGRAVYQTEVSVEEGEVTVYITLHDGSFLNWECVMAKSSDCGHTWQNAGPPPCFPRYAFLRGKIRTSAGILLQAYQSYPVSEELDWLLRRQGTKIYKGTPLIPYNENGVLRSADNGKSWQAYPAIRLPQSENLWHWGEPTVCELPDGTVAMLVRVNRDGRLWRSDSHNGGLTWCVPYRTEIPNPNNKVKLLRLPDGRTALLHTPAVRSMRLTDRYPLSVWISSDGMASWPYRRDLVDFPGAFSYPDGFCSKDGRHLRFAVEFNRHDIYYIDHEIEG